MVSWRAAQIGLGMWTCPSLVLLASCGCTTATMVSFLVFSFFSFSSILFWASSVECASTIYEPPVELFHEPESGSWCNRSASGFQSAIWCALRWKHIRNAFQFRSQTVPSSRATKRLPNGLGSLRLQSVTIGSLALHTVQHPAAFAPPCGFDCLITPHKASPNWRTTIFAIF